MDGLLHRIDGLSPAKRKLLALCLQDESMDLSWLEVESAEPRTPEEARLAAIWQDVLGAERVGIHDNFFDLGGDSILSVRIVAKAHQQGLALTSRQLFEHPTIAALAQLAEPVEPEVASVPATATEARRVLRPEDFPEAELTSDDLARIVARADQLVTEGSLEGTAERPSVLSLD